MDHHFSHRRRPRRLLSFFQPFIAISLSFVSISQSCFRTELIFFFSIFKLFLAITFPASNIFPFRIQVFSTICLLFTASIVHSDSFSELLWGFRCSPSWIFILKGAYESAFLFSLVDSSLKWRIFLASLFSKP